MAFFYTLLADVMKKESCSSIRILDVGGTINFWRQVGRPSEGVEITILNLNDESIEIESNDTGQGRDCCYNFVEGNACCLSQFQDQQFDIVFSNSVIEHLGSQENQKKMVEEARRVGRRYFIQTPNYYFPMEQHFYWLGFQFFPQSLRLLLFQRFSLGWVPKAKNREEAMKFDSSCLLFRKKDLKKLAPEAKIYEEKFLGLTKSFTIYAGWPDD
jgi:ubiquinone/menaquinone biosynthesis C-methylase UbiE